jgi:phosphatidylserine/phosphatidylglycerophosphate/cardiolipin synthase-like enzyme
VFDSARVELVDFPDEAPQLHARVIQPQEGAWDAPHQKLIVIDGLLAFKGSTNLTKEAMRKADQNLDISEVVTNFEEVAALNNRYFATVWKRLTNPDNDVILMGEEPPF